jgi:hypothetical protein
MALKRASRAALKAASAIARIVASGKLISSKLRKVVSHGGHVGFDNLRRCVDLRVSKTSCRNMSFVLFGLND